MGYVTKKHESKVLKLKRILYGLKQVPRAWIVQLTNISKIIILLNALMNILSYKGKWKRYCITCFLVCGWFDLHSNHILWVQRNNDSRVLDDQYWSHVILSWHKS